MGNRSLEMSVWVRGGMAALWQGSSREKTLPSVGLVAPPEPLGCSLFLGAVLHPVHQRLSMSYMGLLLWQLFGVSWVYLMCCLTAALD